MSASPDDDALKLRAAGVAPQRIAKQLGLTAAQVNRAVARALGLRANATGPEVAWALELYRMDMQYRALYSAAMAGDPRANAEALKISEARLRVLGAAGLSYTPMVEAAKETLAALDDLPEYAVARAAVLRIAEQIDAVSAAGDLAENTTATYLVGQMKPYLVELGATPAAVAALKAKAKSGDSDKRAKLTALRGGRTA